MSKVLDSDRFPTVSDFNEKQTKSKERQLSNSLSNLKLETSKQQEYVNHPHFVPNSQPGTLIGQTEPFDSRNNNSIGQLESCDARGRSLIGHVESCDTKIKTADSYEPKGKPPTGSIGGNQSESNGVRNRVFLYR